MSATIIDDGDDSIEVLSLPVAHQQLLSLDPAFFKDLGCDDRNQDVVGNNDKESASFEDARGYQNDQDLDVIGDDTPSWLLAFAPSDDDDEEEDDVYDRIVPGLKRPRGVSFDSAVEADERSSTSTKRPQG